jgi:hypothetical protein
MEKNMKLPTIDLPIYDTTLPSTGEKIKYRAFTVKEEKIMLIAKESRDPDHVITSIKQVLNNCIIGKSIEDLAVFDIEYILAMIRGKSVDNIVDFTIKDPETDEDVKLRLKIDDIKVHRDEQHSNKIRLNDQYVLFMKYPTYDSYAMALKPGAARDPLAYYDTMVACFDKLVSPETVYEFSSFSREEVDDFIEGLGADIIEKIEKFFETMPKLRHEIKYKNRNGTEKTFVIEGTESFFM